jgi:hypothetical protein
MIGDKRYNLVVHFVDIGGIVDHQWLNFLFIIYRNLLNILFYEKGLRAEKD